MKAAITCILPNTLPTPFDVAILSVSPALQRFALRLTRDHAEAEDLVQDTLTSAWAARARFRPGSNMKAWLFRIARNAFLTRVRRSRRQVAWDPDHHHLMLIQEPTQHDAIYDRDLQAALSRLPATQRSALLLVAQQGMSFADAADELGVASGTVKSRVSRARASVLAYVDGERVETDTKVASCLKHPVTMAEHRRPADPPAPSRYQQWKASGATSIG